MSNGNKFVNIEGVMSCMVRLSSICFLVYKPEMREAVLGLDSGESLTVSDIEPEAYAGIKALLES